MRNLSLSLWRIEGDPENSWNLCPIPPQPESRGSCKMWETGFGESLHPYGGLELVRRETHMGSVRAWQVGCGVVDL